MLDRSHSLPKAPFRECRLLTSSHQSGIDSYKCDRGLSDCFATQSQSVGQVKHELNGTRSDDMSIDVGDDINDI